MDTRSLKSYLVPFSILLLLLWVFNRPLSAFGLFVYKSTGLFFSNVVNNIRLHQKESNDLLVAQQRAAELSAMRRRLIIQNKILESDSKKLKEIERALGFKHSFENSIIPTSIIGRSPDNWHKQIIINKGSRDGIKLGRGVITDKGVVGQIQKLSYDTAIVQLVNNPDWRMGVKIARNGQYGILSGNYPDAPYLQFLTVDSDIHVGDEIVTSGIGLGDGSCPYPENFPVARVISVNQDPNEVDLGVKVQFYEDLKSVKEVFVLE
jgi:rod shape-determining protein MreC